MDIVSINEVATKKSFPLRLGGGGRGRGRGGHRDWAVKIQILVGHFWIAKWFDNEFMSIFRPESYSVFFWKNGLLEKVMIPSTVKHASEARVIVAQSLSRH